MKFQAQLLNDISDYQQQFDAAAHRRSGRLAIMIKACEGTSVAGALLHHTRAEAAHRNGLRVLHYGFLRPGSGTAQAEVLAGRVAPVWHRGDRVVADLEDDQLGTEPAYMLLNDWWHELARHGHKDPAGYSGRSYLSERRKVLDIPLAGWIVADYGRLRRPNVFDRLAVGRRQLLGRQFTDGEHGPNPHRASGISGTVDCSYLTRAGVKILLQA